MPGTFYGCNSVGSFVFFSLKSKFESYHPYKFYIIQDET